MKKLPLVPVLALRAFTEFVAGEGQFHGDPNNPDAAKPKVPAKVVDRLIAEGKVELMEAFFDPDDGADDGDGTDLIGTGDTFKMTHLSFGKYVLTGPNIPESTFVEGGKKNAEAALTEYEQAWADRDDADPAAADAGDDDGTTDGDSDDGAPAV